MERRVACAKFSKAQVGKILGVFPKSQMQITYHVLDNGKCKEVTEPLADCSMRDATPGIDLNYWMDNAPAQGLPPKNTQAGEKIYYRCPRDAAVAGFCAKAIGTGLDCSLDPLNSYTWLGVRAVLEKK